MLVSALSWNLAKNKPCGHSTLCWFKYMMDDQSLRLSQAVAFSSQTTLGLSSLVVRAYIRESKKRKVFMCLDLPHYYCTSRGSVLLAKFAMSKCSVQRNMAQTTILRPTKCSP